MSESLVAHHLPAYEQRVRVKFLNLPDLRYRAQRRNPSQDFTHRLIALAPTRTSNSPGKSASAIGGSNLPRNVCQTALAVNWVSHHWRQRKIVDAGTPSCSDSFRPRRKLSPEHNAVARITIAPQYTRRPRNLTDAGVQRDRQSPQQKLKRVVSGSAHPIKPRGLRSKLA